MNYLVLVWLSFMVVACTPATPSASVVSQNRTDMPLTLSNPYTVADLALDAYRNQNLDTYNQVLLKPASSSDIFTQVELLTPEDRVQSLYFQDDKGREIAAVVHLGDANRPSIYFWIVRRDGKFLVQDFRVTSNPPDTEISVEGF